MNQNKYRDADGISKKYSTTVKWNIRNENRTMEKKYFNCDIMLTLQQHSNNGMYFYCLAIFHHELCVVICNAFEALLKLNDSLSSPPPPRHAAGLKQTAPKRKPFVPVTIRASRTTYEKRKQAEKSNNLNDSER